MDDLDPDDAALPLDSLVELLIPPDAALALGGVLVDLPVFEVVVVGLLVETVDLQLAVVGRLFALDGDEFIDELFVLVEDFLRLAHGSIFIYNQVGICAMIANATHNRNECGINTINANRTFLRDIQDLQYYYFFCRAEDKV